MINVYDSDGEPCGGCGKASFFVIEGTPGLDMSPGDTLPLCQQCAIKTEALLRGARKHGPRVGNWTPG